VTIDALAPWYLWVKSAHLIGAFARTDNLNSLLLHESG